MFQGKKVKYILYFGVIVAIGSGGFYTIGGDEWSIIDSIYMTIITLSTVGVGAVYPLSDLGKLWKVIVIIFGVSGFAAILYELGAELIQMFDVERLSTCDGKTIAEIKLREDHGLLIVGISNINGETEINPGSEKRLLSGQKIMVIGSQENLTRFNEKILK